MGRSPSSLTETESRPDAGAAASSGGSSAFADVVAAGAWAPRSRVFFGTLRFSPCESGYVQLLVATPLR